MSVPHTGKLKASITGQVVEFDGNTWTSEDSALADDLNLATSSVPKTHLTILERAAQTFTQAGISERAVTIHFVEYDRWPEDLPPGAID